MLGTFDLDIVGKNDLDIANKVINRGVVLFWVIAAEFHYISVFWFHGVFKMYLCIYTRYADY